MLNDFFVSVCRQFACLLNDIKHNSGDSRLHKYNARVPTCYFDIKGKYSTFSKGNLPKDFCLDYSKMVYKSN